MITLEQFRAAVEGRLIVSCQAPAAHPLRDTDTMVRMARAAEKGGAAAIRCGGVGGTADVEAIAGATALPVIGLTKDGTEGVFITPTVGSALAVAKAGAEVVATDATGRPRPDGSTLADLVTAVHAIGALVMADVATCEQGVAAARAGADIVATTLSGYVDGSRNGPGPDLDLVRELAAALPGALLVAEGRYHTPQAARAAIEHGATSVVVGTAITDPVHITGAFAAAVAGAGGAR